MLTDEGRPELHFAGYCSQAAHTTYYQAMSMLYKSINNCII